MNTGIGLRKRLSGAILNVTAARSLGAIPLLLLIFLALLVAVWLVIPLLAAIALSCLAVVRHSASFLNKRYARRSHMADWRENSGARHGLRAASQSRVRGRRRTLRPVQSALRSRKAAFQKQE